MAVLLLAFVAEMQPVTPQELTVAARAGDVARLADLLDHGGNLEARNEDGLTPLMEATRAGEMRTVAFLLARGANIEARSGVFGTSVGLAAMDGYPQILKLLLAHHANPNTSNDYGVTPLMWAANSGSDSEQMVKLLKAAGATAARQSRPEETPSRHPVLSDPAGSPPDQ